MLVISLWDFIELNAALSHFQNARCGAEQGQTQTITRESSTITVAPIDGNYLQINILLVH